MKKFKVQFEIAIGYSKKANILNITMLLKTTKTPTIPKANTLLPTPHPPKKTPKEPTKNPNQNQPSSKYRHSYVGNKNVYDVHHHMN